MHFIGPLFTISEGAIAPLSPPAYVPVCDSMFVVCVCMYNEVNASIEGLQEITF